MGYIRLCLAHTRGESLEGEGVILCEFVFYYLLRQLDFILSLFFAGKQYNASTCQETGDTHSDDDNNSQPVSLKSLNIQIIY